MTEDHFLCNVEDVSSNKAKIIKINNKSIGVFKLNDGSIHALLNLCPHRGAALCEGPICGTTEATDSYNFKYIKDNEIIRCSWHGWEFDIKTGEFLVDKKVKVRKFPLEIKGNEIFIKI